jgi:hypothetical protein
MVAGSNPLRGPNDAVLGDRFPPVSDAYDATLQSIVMSIGESIGLGDILRPDSVYCMAAGPSYESKAECRFLASVGGHTVGMSTIPEIIAARHCGMKVLCLSFVTNKVVTGLEQYEVVPASHGEVMEAVDKGGKNIEQLVRQFVSKARIGEYLHSTKPAPTFDYQEYLKTAPTTAKGKGGCSNCNACGSTNDVIIHVAATVAITAVSMFAGYMIAKRK